MKDILNKIHSYIEEHQLFSDGDKVIAAISGGPDSMALLHYLLHHAKKRLNIEVAHVDHMLRGEESKKDADFVEAYCEQQGIPCHRASLDVKKKMEMEGTGLQEAARAVRYDYLKEVMTEIRASKLVLGHHGDDQAETVLFRLVRGSTMKGRAGIAAKRNFAGGVLVRPLLALTKAEIEQYCEHYRIEYRIDPSNAKDSYTRNRIRHHIIPLLKEENPSLNEQIKRYTEEVKEDEDWLLQQAEDRLQKRIIEQQVQFMKIERKNWCKEAPPLQRRMIHLILNYLYAKVPTSLSSAHTASVRKLMEQKHPSGELHLPKGLLVQRSYSTVTFHFVPSAQALPYCYRLDQNEAIVLPGGGKVIAKEGLVEDLDETADFCWLNPSEVEWPLTVRTKKDGDRIHLKGMNGSKKIKKIFIDEKIPLDLRGQWPIVTDACGRVLWIPGLRTAQGVEKPSNGNRACTLIHYKDLLGGHSSC
ncbi:tRNA lysidine(34) synthetase TilS [Jeotgalibacillus sp. ET6]|uniref:tRNA lysidine(34) synthetase TilS n=1 Tax=Jeotgalibacillus sp. ET6 TaxID=3037260 RepID=UPI0024186434|nr:tRNA lysidine(34) synthetase TilS [Jeotgalibacillus sp. ET6]MDG5473812.1 tRNA lysidine(34) synthetase TilS [Jeotgalibacillus sp. ET6]